MSIFILLLGFWLLTYYNTIFVLAQGNHTTLTTTTTLVIPAFTFAPNWHRVSSSPTMTTIYTANTDVLALAAAPTAATSTTTTASDTRSDVAQSHALKSLPSTIATSSASSAFTTSPSPPHKAAPPAWMLPASISLLFYDFLSVTAFIWCWVMGYSWWRRRDSAEVRVLRAEREAILGMLIDENLEWEMRRLGMA